VGKQNAGRLEKQPPERRRLDRGHLLWVIRTKGGVRWAEIIEHAGTQQYTVP
jgi:hypothetical protein